MKTAFKEKNTNAMTIEGSSINIDAAVAMGKEAYVKSIMQGTTWSQYGSSREAFAGQAWDMLKEESDKLQAKQQKSAVKESDAPEKPAAKASK